MARLFGSKAAYRATDATIQPHRGAANIKDDLDERYAHGARITRVYEGASETGGSHHPQNLAVMALRRQSNLDFSLA
jgi:hypothetical protein